jgi:hypothetical protein
MNPNYGRPCARKLKQREQAWSMNRQSWALLRSIHTELDKLKPVALEQESHEWNQ